MAETNFEHYKDEIIKCVLLTGNEKCAFIKKYILKVKNCTGTKCDDCFEKVKQWFDKPYTEPVIEIDWSKVPVDTPVIATNAQGLSHKRHFAEFDGNYVYTFDAGHSSWSVPEVSKRYISTWSKVELAREEDVEKYKKD